MINDKLELPAQNEALVRIRGFMLYSLSIYENSEFSLYLREAIHACKQELRSHAKASNEKFGYYSAQYFALQALKPFIDPFCPNSFYSSAIKIIITHPFLTKSSQPLINRFIVGIKIAILGPLLSYSLSNALSSNYTILMIYLINNMVRSVVARILFLPPNASPLPLLFFLPGILLAGAIRGALLYHFCSPLKDRGFDKNDVFFWSMIIKHIFEPQVKKLEKMNISLLSL